MNMRVIAHTARVRAHTHNAPPRKRVMATPKMDASQLKAGDFLSRISYMRVKSLQGDNVEVENEHGFSWSISKSILEAECTTAHQYSKTEKVTRTELARILEQDVRDAVFSCCFNKLPSADDQEKALAAADLSTSAKRKRVAKELGVGPERIMYAHIVDTHELGRVPVYDLEAKGERLVDLRTLKWIVFNNVKYEVK